METENFSFTKNTELLLIPSYWFCSINPQKYITYADYYIKLQKISYSLCNVNDKLLYYKYHNYQNVKIRKISFGLINNILTTKLNLTNNNDYKPLVLLFDFFINSPGFENFFENKHLFYLEMFKLLATTCFKNLDLFGIFILQYDKIPELKENMLEAMSCVKELCKEISEKKENKNIDSLRLKNVLDSLINFKKDLIRIKKRIDTPALKFAVLNMLISLFNLSYNYIIGKNITENNRSLYTHSLKIFIVNSIVFITEMNPEERYGWNSKKGLEALLESISDKSIDFMFEKRMIKYLNHIGFLDLNYENYLERFETVLNTCENNERAFLVKHSKDFCLNLGDAEKIYFIIKNCKKTGDNIYGNDICLFNNNLNFARFEWEDNPSADINMQNLELSSFEEIQDMSFE